MGRWPRCPERWTGICHHRLLSFLRNFLTWTAGEDSALGGWPRWPFSSRRRFRASGVLGLPSQTSSANIWEKTILEVMFSPAGIFEPAGENTYFRRFRKTLDDLRKLSFEDFFPFPFQPAFPKKKPFWIPDLHPECKHRTLIVSPIDMNHYKLWVSFWKINQCQWWWQHFIVICQTLWRKCGLLEFSLSDKNTFFI